MKLPFLCCSFRAISCSQYVDCWSRLSL